MTSKHPSTAQDNSSTFFDHGEARGGDGAKRLHLLLPPIARPRREVARASARPKGRFYTLKKCTPAAAWLAWTRPPSLHTTHGLGGGAGFRH